MAIEAPIGKFKKNGLKMYIAICIGLTIWCIYDSYFNEDFINKYTVDGKMVGWGAVNKKAPPFLIGTAVLLGVYLFTLRNKKLIADENELIISDKDKIPYDSMQQIDRTHFDSKGYFILTYKNENDKEVERKISTRRYDNLKDVLNHLVDQLKNSTTGEQGHK